MSKLKFNICIIDEPSDFSLSSINNYLHQNNFCDLTISDVKSIEKLKKSYNKKIITKNLSNIESPLKRKITLLENNFDKLNIFLRSNDLIISSAKHEQLNYDGSVNVMPNYIITNDNGVDKILNFQISNESSQARIIEIIDKFGSFYFNVIPVFLDGNTLKDIMNYLKFHPFAHTSVSDYAVLIASLSSLPLIRDKSSTYIFGDTKSFDNFDAKKNSKIDEISFLDNQIILKNFFLLLALDSFILILRKSSPLQIDEKVKTSKSVLFMFIKMHLNYVMHNVNFFQQLEKELILEFETLNDIKSIISLVLDIISISETSFTERYNQFITQCIDLKLEDL